MIVSSRLGCVGTPASLPQGIVVPAPGYRGPLHPTMRHLCARRSICQSRLPFPLLWMLLPLRSKPTRCSPETARVSSLCSSRS